MWGIWWTEKLSNFRRVTQLISGRLGFILLQPGFKIHAFNNLWSAVFHLSVSLYFSGLGWITAFAKNYTLIIAGRTSYVLTGIHYYNVVIIIVLKA